MDTKISALTRQDWTLFGLRWLTLILTALALHFAVLQGNFPAYNNNLPVVLVIGATINILFLAAAFFPATHRILPVLVILGDWLVTGLFINISQTNPIFFIAITGAMIVSGAIYLGILWGSLQAAGVLGVALGTLYMLGDATQFNVLINELSIPLLLSVLLALVGLVWSFAMENQESAIRREHSELVLKTVLLQEDMRERTRAISEMSATLSRTLNFDKVLEVALEAGRAGMRANNQDRRVVSAALLFNQHQQLHVATARGLTRNDETLTLPGEEGVVGRALKECVPVFGKDARKDPELEYMVGFQPMRSLMCIPLRAGYENFGVLLYGSESPDAFTEDHMDLLKAISTQATIALQNATLYRNLLEEKERIVDVEEDARKKLARDLHDGPTQNVSAIAMRMSYIYRLLERKPDDVPEELKKVEELARKTTREIRHMLFTLRPLVLESQGLEAALNQLADKIQETHGQAVAVRVDRRVEAVLDNHQQGVIFYIIEEAVGNARKHAEAEVINVMVRMQEEAVIVQIADNGVGFDTGAVDANYDQRGSLGMVNMRERTELLDGVLNIDSAEGKGTTITVMVPVRSAMDSTEIRKQRSNRLNVKQPANR